MEHPHHLTLFVVSTEGDAQKAVQKVQGLRVLSELTSLKPVRLYRVDEEVWHVTYQLGMLDKYSADVVGEEIVKHLIPKLEEVELKVLDWVVRASD